jgi:hypothetical protein
MPATAVDRSGPLRCEWPGETRPPLPLAGLGLPSPARAAGLPRLRQDLGVITLTAITAGLR